MGFNSAFKGLIERKYFGCTRDDVRRLSVQLAVQNKIPNQFSIAKEAAGKDWFKRFMKWHSEKLSLRPPTETFTARARNRRRFSLICTKNSLLFMITLLRVFFIVDENGLTL